jgi:hypothetical protein
MARIDSIITARRIGGWTDAAYIAHANSLYSIDNTLLTWEDESRESAESK